MYLFDIETLSKSSEAVILSMAAIYFDPSEKYEYKQLLESAFFVKFNVEDQIKRLKRRADKSTMDWWAKQCEYAKKKSFYPSPNEELKFEDGYEIFRSWVKRFTIEKQKEWIFVRGQLDQLCVESMCDQLEIDKVFPYTQYRDVRTAIDLMYDTKNGYVEVENFDPQANVIKHCPVHDCAYDVMQLLYGKQTKQ